MSVPGNRWDLLDGRWPDAPPAVTVVVVHFDQPEALARTLAALVRQTHPADRLEVVVVDDGSPTPPLVPDGVRLLRQEDAGFRAAAARNLGAARAAGEVLCFLDADTTPEPDFVRELTRLPALVPDAVSVGLRRHAELGGAPEPVELAGPAAELEAPAWLARGYAETRDLLDADDRSYRFVISAVLACRRAFFEEVGGFDEGSTAYGGEDWEWAHRAWLAGAVLAHVPAAVAWHDGPEWAGRDDPLGRRRTKNAEALRLASLVPVPGSRGHAVRGPRADVLVALPATGAVAGAFVCADALLAALPEATVVVPDGVHGPFASEARVRPASEPLDPVGARVHVALERLVRVRDPRALRAALERVGAEGLGALELLGDDGTPLARLVSARAVARARRHGSADGFPVVREPAPWLTPLDDEPDVEAYVGGWG